MFNIPKYFNINKMKMLKHKQTLIQDIHVHDQKMNLKRFNSYRDIRLKWSESGHIEYSTMLILSNGSFF